MDRGYLFFGVFLFAGFLQAQPSRLEVAEAWAPVLYQDISSEFTQVATGFNPVDHLVDLFFDGNQDLRDNGLNIFRLSDERAISLIREASVYYAVIETRSHWYINYIFYRAIDMNVWPHAHDTENLWVVVRKTEKTYGEAEMWVSVAHGYPNIYGLDPERVNAWRTKPQYGIAARLMYLLDRHSKLHQQGDLEFISRKSGSKAVQLFGSSRTHALYKFSTEAWRSGNGHGIAYYPRSCGVDCDTVGWISENPATRIPYQLKSWDEIHGRFASGEMPVFTNQKFQHRITEARFLPKFLVPGDGEVEARALLFHMADLKTPHTLSDPARLHRYFEETRAGISLEYLYNPYIDPRPLYQNAWSMIADGNLDAVQH